MRISTPFGCEESVHQCTVAGVPEIDVGPSEEACYGATVSCRFPVAQAFSGAGLKAEKICEFGWVDNGATAYWVSAPGKVTVAVVYARNTGNRLENAWLEIRPFAASSDVCDELYRRSDPGEGPSPPPSP